MPYSVFQVMSFIVGSPGKSAAKRSVRLTYCVNSCEKEGRDIIRMSAAIRKVRRMRIPPKLLTFVLNTAGKENLAHQICVTPPLGSTAEKETCSGRPATYEEQHEAFRIHPGCRPPLD